ncbi:MAG: HAMP domain-containing histidine kinase [Syntrophomonadaceae bacterium]|nr:HAMP domain-containing histidine kinase [Syntrophomonadaceae bacterium]
MENYQRFSARYADRIAQLTAQQKADLIKDDLRRYHLALQKLAEYPGVFYYASDGENMFTNSPSADKAFFKDYPAYLIWDKAESAGYPPQIQPDRYIFSSVSYVRARDGSFYTVDTPSRLADLENKIYLAFTPEFLNPRLEAWQNNKETATGSLQRISGFSAGLLAALLYLLLVAGRKAFGDKEVHLNFVDTLYTDLNLGLCLALIALWVGAIGLGVLEYQLNQATWPITAGIGALGLILVLSLVRHLKNRTLLKHSLLYTVLHKVYRFLQRYASGSLGWKIAVVVIGYPLLVALTFFMFPVTIGAAVWLAFKKVQEYQAIQAGLARVREGDLQHKIAVIGSGELAKLAEDINRMTEGLNKAVANELKSERLKTELITNVSHDIRTPLTSIITYVDLLKGEKDPDQAAKYLEVIDQKSQHLKILTDDLFEAAKASSGSIPVNLERIDLTSLITQGLGELDDKIQAQQLEFKLNHPPEKVYITADDKLFWRALENLFANIFKYALPGSRVYIEVDDLGESARLVLKNISAAELNVSAEALLERFVRGDEARSTQGSGLGLSIAKSLIEMQRGRFDLEIDGDLFKVIILMPK